VRACSDPECPLRPAQREPSCPSRACWRSPVPPVGADPDASERRRPHCNDQSPDGRSPWSRWSLIDLSLDRASSCAPRQCCWTSRTRVPMMRFEKFDLESSSSESSESGNPAVTQRPDQNFAQRPCSHPCCTVRPRHCRQHREPVFGHLVIVEAPCPRTASSESRPPQLPQHARSGWKYRL
jgi:hypothetical protein